MNAEGKHDCFNRERRDAYLGSSGRSIPDRSSKECQYSKDVADPHCVGCKHNRKELGEHPPPARV